MTKKDYELIARQIRESRKWADEYNHHAVIAIAYITGRFISALGHANPRFDADKFAEACKPE